MNRKFLFPFIFSVQISFLKAQENKNFNLDFLNDEIEFLSEDNSAAEDLLTYQSELEELFESPVNINSHSHVLFEKKLISKAQSNQIIKYIQSHGELIHLNELQSIPGIDFKTIQRIRPFIEIKPISQKISDINTKKNNTVFIQKLEQKLEKEKGFHLPKNIGYQGDQLKLLTRCKSELSKDLNIGFTLEKDPGERYFHQSIEFFSFYLSYARDNGNFQLIVGDFHVRFGQGSIVWLGSPSRKSIDVLQIKKVASSFRPIASTHESAFMRGVALKKSLTDKVSLHSFYSTKTIDARLDESRMHILSIPENGLHRTDAEIEAKNQAIKADFGIQLLFEAKHFKISGALSSTILNIRKKTPFQLEFPSLPKNISKSLFTSYNFDNAELFAELGIHHNNSTALIAGIINSLGKNISLATYLRRISNSFILDNNILSESSTGTNERGVYNGLTYTPNPTFAFSIYHDLFFFPHKSFRSSLPSSGQEYLTQFDYMRQNFFHFTIRYFSEKKEKEVQITDAIHKKSELLKTEKFRVEFKHQPDQKFKLKTRIEFIRIRSKSVNNESGVLFFQDLKFHPISSNFSWNMRWAIFNTSSFASRIYAYENDVLYSFSIPPYYGRGQRLYFVFRHKLNRKITYWLRYARTFFFDRDVIGSGLSEIQGNIKSDIKFQLRLTF